VHERALEFARSVDGAKRIDDQLTIQ